MRTGTNGFALPVVVITSVVMFTVLVAAVGIVSSSRTTLLNQYYDDLAKDAAESAVTYAEICLNASNNTGTWGSSELHPNTGCNGGAACTDSANCYVLNENNIRTTFTVAPATTNSYGITSANVTGTVSLVRPTAKTVWRSLDKSAKMIAKGKSSTKQVVFGYDSAWGTSDPIGAFFAIINNKGEVSVAGLNRYGQLGNGTTNSVLEPIKYTAPTANPIVAVYTSFLSIGWNLYVVDDKGNAYGSGRNNWRQLGSGATTDTVTSPQLIQLPAGKKVAKIVPSGWTNYFLTTDNLIYAAGMCTNGALGDGAPTSGCVDKTIPVKVALPSPNANDLNTIPTQKMSADRYNAYVVMQGGRVYGWGDNAWRQLGRAGKGAFSTPVQIGSWGDAGQPKAVDVMFDGATVGVLDDTGKLSTIGSGHAGQLGNREMMIDVQDNDWCMADVNNNGGTIGYAPCNGSPSQLFTFYDDKIWNKAQNKCLDNMGGDGVRLWLYPCIGGTTQNWIWKNVFTLQNTPGTNKCITNMGGWVAQLVVCNGTDQQRFSRYSSVPRPFNMAGIAGIVTKAVTDGASYHILTSEGEVWSVGYNVTGQMGNNTTSPAVFDPIKFQLPEGVRAIDVAEASYSNGSNLFVIGSDRRVYGAGSNDKGQLGIGTVTPYEASPKVMNQIDGVVIRATSVQTGGGNTIVFTEDGTIFTVGDNGFGQLGDGTTTSSSTPIRARYINGINSQIY